MAALALALAPPDIEPSTATPEPRDREPWLDAFDVDVMRVLEELWLRDLAVGALQRLDPAFLDRPASPPHGRAERPCGGLG